MLLFVAAEMLLAEIIEIRQSASLAVIVCIFGIAIVASRSFPVPRRRAEEQTGGRSPRNALSVFVASWSTLCVCTNSSRRSSALIRRWHSATIEPGPVDA